MAAANSAVYLLAYIVILIARNTATLGFELNCKWIVMNRSQRRVKFWAYYLQSQSDFLHLRYAVMSSKRFIKNK